MRHPLRHRLLTAAAAAALGLTAHSALAQTGTTDAPQQARPQDLAPADVEDINTGGLDLSAGVDVTTAYYFRGIIQENQGVIVQPYAQIGIDIAETDDVEVAGYVGIWNSFHDEQTGSDGAGPDIWYEADLYGGVGLGFGDFGVDFIYTAYTSPNGAFNTVQEVGVAAAYAGEADFGDNLNFGFEVGGGVFFELDNTAFGDDEGIYAEVGITPSFGIEVRDQEVAIGIPVVLGFSIDDYYEADDDDELGFVSVGVTAGVPLAFIPERYGDWSVSGALTGLFLVGDNLEDANSGDEFELIGTVGVSMTY